MKGVLEERAVELGVYILENKATVRAAAKEFDISKSTVHTAVPNRNGTQVGSAWEPHKRGPILSFEESRGRAFFLSPAFFA